MLVPHTILQVIFSFSSTYNMKNILLVIMLCLGGGFCIQIDDLITGGKCGVSTKISGGVVVSHQPIDTLPPISNNITCFYTMQALKFRQKIRFVLLFFALTPADCSLSYLKIYDGKNDKSPLIATVCPGDSPGVEYTSTSFWMTLKLQVTRLSDPPTANFTGYYVSYTNDRDPCVEPANELMCGNGRCIYKELQCDGYDSCGDGTDEDTGSPTFCNVTTTTSGPTTTTKQEPASAPTPAPTSPTPPGDFGDNDRPNFPAVLPPEPPDTASTSSTTTTPAATTTTTPTTTVTTTPSNITISSSTTSSLAVVNGVLLDLTPLYIVLTLTFAIFSAYLLYSLLAVQCFKTCMTSCLHRCCLMAIRRRRMWKEGNEEPGGRLRRKITPENRKTSMIIENLSTCDLQRNGKLSMDGKESVYASSVDVAVDNGGLNNNNKINDALIGN